jgi:DNA-binding transcriptional ArsR family regulator
MVQHASTLDLTFSALSDRTRRGILERLGLGSATISDLAARSGMSLTGLRKHVRILERAGLVTTEKRGRARHCHLGPERLDDVSHWIEDYRRFWDASYERLDEYLETLKEKEGKHGHGK